MWILLGLSLLIFLVLQREFRRLQRHYTFLALVEALTPQMLILVEAFKKMGMSAAAAGASMKAFGETFRLATLEQQAGTDTADARE